RRIIPGFHLSLGYTMLYVSLLVLLPLSMIFIHTMSLSWSAFIDIITDPRAVASYKVSFSTALIAGLLNVFFGTTIAWVLVR
ncbi:sulfate ABC transporter permease subunit CysT, partial [Escherichia coli]|nr:sulfate ABC transporter permease subunit CysT [Escherichia coli]